MIYFRLFILTVSILLSQEISAQTYELGAAGYATGYMGDINTSDLLYYKGAGAGIFVKYAINPTWGLRLAFNHLSVKANDSDFNNSNQIRRNLSFHNNLSELSLLTDFQFLKFETGNSKNRFTPYLLAGVGIVRHDPFLYYADSKIYLRSLGLEQDKDNNPMSYTALAFIIPFGLGFKYNIKGPWTVGIESIYRVAFTDNIDNVSGYYRDHIPSANDLPNITINNADGTIRSFDDHDWQFLGDPSNNYPKNIRTLRGDGKKWDGYMTTGLTLTYTWKSTACAWYN